MTTYETIRERRRPRHHAAAACILLSMSGGVAGAQTAPGGVYLGGASAPPPAAKTCVQVQIAGQQPSIYNCLNQQLRAQAQGAVPGGVPAPPLGAGSPGNAVGTFNEQGVKEQYGQNFGKSVLPYRPPAPVFASGIP